MKNRTKHIIEKVRKLIIPGIVAILAISGSISYMKRGNVVINKSSTEINTSSETYVANQIETQNSNLESSKSVEIQSKTSKVNLNTATGEELQIAPGIGPSKAEAIIKYRNEYGNFSSVDELIEVSGIGEKTLAKIREYYTVE